MEEDDVGLDCLFAPLGQKVRMPPVFELVAATVHWTVAFRWVQAPTAKRMGLERSAEQSEVKKCPVDTFLDRGRVPRSQTAVRRTVG